jgi:hypothetical protein
MLSSEEDYLFTRDLSHHWSQYSLIKSLSDGKLVKDKYNVTADFYALKHLFLDGRIKPLVKALSYQRNGQPWNWCDWKVYLIGRNSRKNEALKNIEINIITA